MGDFQSNLNLVAHFMSPFVAKIGFQPNEKNFSTFFADFKYNVISDIIYCKYSCFHSFFLFRMRYLIVAVVVVVIGISGPVGAVIGKADICGGRGFGVVVEDTGPELMGTSEEVCYLIKTYNVVQMLF